MLVINHGRATDGAGRAALGRARYSDASRWFARLGFAVVVPTRLGYGVSGGDDVEDSGACAAKNYPPGYAAAAEETIAALRFMHQRADTLKDRDVVVGQSYGGATLDRRRRAQPGAAPSPRSTSPAAAAAIRRSAPARRARRSGSSDCSRSTARPRGVPTLWIYSVNDMYFGPDLPQHWFKAFQAGRRLGRFIQVPPSATTDATFAARRRVAVVAEFRRAGFDIKDCRGSVANRGSAPCRHSQAISPRRLMFARS